MHLHRSFKPQECKTLLGLAMSRLKLLRNKKAVEVNRRRREVAQLLDSGQDWTTRIQVEHVIREENILFVYDLLDVYCELIVTRLQLIESQKICPIDLKEAISSLLFASQRCADVPELSKVCKQFSAKYGKDFVNSALELRPKSGVPPLLVEKLSSKAPDIETKIKVLSSIASDNGIKWEPKSFGESLQRPNEGLQNCLERSSNSTKDTNKPEVAFQSIQKHESVKSAIANEAMSSAASDLTFKTKLQGPTSFQSESLFARESSKPESIPHSNQMHEVQKAPLINDVEGSIKSSESISSGSAGIAFMQSQLQTMPPGERSDQDEDCIGMSVDFHDERGIETKYAPHSYDGKRTVEETERAHTLELTAASDGRRSNFSGGSSPTFDGDSSYSGDYVDFDNLGKTEENPCFQNQESRLSDFPTYVEPLPKQQTESSANENSSSQARSMKKSCIDQNANNTGKYSFSLSSSDILAPFYDSDPNESKEMRCIDSLSQQNDGASMHSESQDYEDYESERVLRIEYLTGGLRNRGFPHPPPLASVETPNTDSSPIKNANETTSSFEILSKAYGQKQHEKHYNQKTSLSSDSDGLEGENFQPTSEKGKFDPGLHKTRQESLREASENSFKSTVVNSDIDTRIKMVNASLSPHKSPDDVSPDTKMASAFLRHKMPPISGSSNEEVFDGEPCVEELDSERSMRQSGPSNCDSEDSQSYQSYVRRRPKNIIMQSRRTRGPALNSKNNLLSKSPEKAEISDIQTISQVNMLDMSASSKFLPHESQTERPFVTTSSPPKGTSSDEAGDGGLFGLESRKKLGARPVSIFQPMVSWRKSIPDEDFESLPQENDEDSESSLGNLEHTPYSGRTKRTNKPASSSSEFIKKVDPERSSPGDSAISVQTSSLENEAPKSTSSTSSKGQRKITTIKSSQSNLERNLSIENKDKAKHIHPKLPDSDKLLAHFQALRSNA